MDITYSPEPVGSCTCEACQEESASAYEQKLHELRVKVVEQSKAIAEAEVAYGQAGYEIAQLKGQLAAAEREDEEG